MSKAVYFAACAFTLMAIPSCGDSASPDETAVEPSAGGKVCLPDYDLSTKCNDNPTACTQEERERGIYPSYYGPYAPNCQQKYCENKMDPGTYSIMWAPWAHGPKEEWAWQYLQDNLEMKPNMRYLLTCDSLGEISIKESEDTSLTGYTVLCVRNQGPDKLVLSLEPEIE